MFHIFIFAFFALLHLVHQQLPQRTAQFVLWLAGLSFLFFFFEGNELTILIVSCFIYPLKFTFSFLSEEDPQVYSVGFKE